MSNHKFNHSAALRSLHQVQAVLWTRILGITLITYCLTVMASPSSHKVEPPTDLPRLSTQRVAASDLVGVSCPTVMMQQQQ